MNTESGNMTEESFFAKLRNEWPKSSLVQIYQRMRSDMIAAQEAAFLYHESALDLRTALDEVLCDNTVDYDIHDEILERARSIENFRAKNMHSHAEETRKERIMKIIDAAVNETHKKRGTKAKPARKASKRK